MNDYDELKREPDKKAPAPDITADDYLVTFSSYSGKRTLAHIMVDCHFFDECSTEEDVIQRNMVTRILHRMGALRIENIHAMAEAMVSIAKKSRKKGIDK